MNKSLNSRIRGSLIGGAIGDALGYQIEFKRGVKDKEVVKYQDGKGIISDDTQMCLFTANALLWRETRGILRGIALSPANAIYESYLDWLDTQNNTHNHRSISWIKEIPELNIKRAPGNTCLSALLSGKMGTIDNPINNSKGCGGIMRVAPIGLYTKDSVYAGELGAESSAITHGHPLGILPCYILASMLNMIVYYNETIETALDKSIRQYYDEYNIFNKDDVDYLISLIDKAKRLAKDDIPDIEAISSLGEGWAAEETFAIAIYSCLKYPNSFQDAIICSINHDGDSDSTGAVAGNIIGAYLGYDAILNYYKDNLELKDVILELADDISVDEIPVSQYTSDKDEEWKNRNKKWEDKYLYCKYNKEDITKDTNDFELSTHWSFDWGSYYLEESNLDGFLRIIGIDKNNLTFNCINDLINQLVYQGYLICFDPNPSRAIDVIDTVNRLCQKYGLDIGLTIEDLEEEIESNPNYYQKYREAKNNPNICIKCSGMEIISLANKVLSKECYKLMDVRCSTGGPYYFLAKSEDVENNPNIAMYR